MSIQHKSIEPNDSLHEAHELAQTEAAQAVIERPRWKLFRCRYTGPGGVKHWLSVHAAHEAMAKTMAYGKTPRAWSFDWHVELAS